MPTLLVAGLAGGIGSALARRLHAQGWTVAGYGRDAAKLAALEADLPGLVTATGDATDPAQVEAVHADLATRAGASTGFDAYVHCVGSILLKSAHLTSPEEWRRTQALNLDSAFYGLRTVIGPMQARGSGAIVLISSVAAATGLPSHEAIAAAKAGIEGLARSAAASYAGRNVRVNVVAPSLTDTPLAAALLSSPPARAFSEKMHPLGRVGTADQIAAAIAYLLSPDADWITGQVWGIDGGLSTVRPRPKA
jgi:NAD(P)-dependent dehydrogenase (short-subunit alcohol dehydrogenase family)